jgi:3-oxoacyl-(acyl-carrier-protein) synthase
VGRDYAPDEIALFGATGMAGLPLREVAPLIKASVGADGKFDLRRFGEAGLKAINPLLSFKILSNMPLCFVSMCENIQGPNSIYTPWEGQGAQAIEAGMRALEWGDARCALVGGCDVKTHELAFISLEQQGLFRSWRETGQGLVPGEGAVFLVLEPEAACAARGVKPYARLTGCRCATLRQAAAASSRAQTYARLLQALLQPSTVKSQLSTLAGSADGDPAAAAAEAQALASARIACETRIYPKRHAGNLFAAAAPLQVALGALWARQLARRVLANCFGHGSEQAAFLLDPV